ncbi:MAG: hypothetical protein IJ897_09020 [Prevotella sp.]|nr:hypothetical protein [Prevotella sp.]
MKNLTLVIGGIILLLNIVIGLIFSSYEPFNIGLNSAVIIVNTLMLYSFGVVQIKDGFKVSLSFLFLITAAIEYILVLFVPETWKDNAVLMTLILLLAGQIILYIIAYFVSKIS